jgi:serine protease AprX
VGEFDFIQNDTITSNQTGDATQQDIHGTQVLSVLGGYMPGSLVGPAFGANFLLAKTEKIDEEIHQEEDNWAMAAEWAEGLGVDIISSSLGYSIFVPQQTDYSYSDMDGETTIITRAANELALRGVIVVSGAGNEGNSDWHFITAPADGFYVLAVGALDHDNNITSFSSRGPSSDQRIKPDVSGLGSQVYTVKPDSNFGYYNGTSLSCPLVGGICAQILQANSELNLLQMNDIIKNSGDTAGNPDNERGWGKVDALAAWNLATGLTNGGAYQKPLTVKLHSPRPNPISKGRGFIFFPIELPEPAVITLNIYNILGQKVFQSEYNGTNTQNLLSWNLHNFFGEIVPAGMYFYRIQIESKLLLGKFIIVN